MINNKHLFLILYYFAQQHIQYTALKPKKLKDRSSAYLS